MKFPESNSPASSPAEYCRQARRLRHQFQYNPTKLHRSLQQLSAQSRPALASTPPVPVQPLREQCETFAQVVAQHLDGPILRYSNRQLLLREAKRRGIGHFEANLIIAAVQHQTPAKPLSAPSKTRRFPSRLTTFALIQTTILLGLWWLLRSF